MGNILRRVREALKNAGDKIEDALKKVGDKLEDAFQQAKDTVNSFIKDPQNLITSAGLTPLLPFQHIMKKKLKKIGKPQGDNLAETTHNFVKYVMGINTFEDWQFENFQNASFTTTIEDLEFADEENLDPTIIAAIIQLIPVIIQFIMSLKKEEPDLEDPNNPSPDIDPNMKIDHTDLAILLPLADTMIRYLTNAGQTYSNDPFENAIKIYQLTYPNKQTFEFENALGPDLQEFWQNNREEILATIAALFVAIGTDPAPDPISQRIGKTVSSTQTAIKKEVKKQTKLKTYTPLLILAAILLIIVLTKKK